LKTKIISAPEVAYLLRRELGPIRSWDDALADMRRGKTDVNGFTLKPACRVRDGRAWRPMYRGFEVAEFIKAVRATNSDARRDAPPQIKVAIFDPADHREWKARKLTTAATVYVVGRPAPFVSISL
jgi:Rad3-related DNA helicase